MKVTIKLLHQLGACSNQIQEFAERSLDGEVITADLCARHAMAFDWAWAARHLLPPHAQAIYAPAEAAAIADYERATAAAWADYERVRASALAYYNLVNATAFGRLAEQVG